MVDVVDLKAPVSALLDGGDHSVKKVRSIMWQALPYSDDILQLYVQMNVSMEECALLQIIAAALENGMVSSVSNVSSYHL